MITFQEILRRLSKFWEEQGCIIHQGYDLEVGAGTMNPATFLRCLGPEPYRAAYIEPCRRPADGRYGDNPNRLQHYFQYQVILKPSPLNMQSLYVESLKAIGFNLSEHDIRFVHDDWENPTIGAWGLGWEVWMDGMEVTQYTYFQSVGGVPVKPVTGELTYGIERLAMYLQNVDSIFDLKWNEHLTYGDIYHRNEVEWSHYNFEEATTKMWFKHFDDFENESKTLIAKKFPIPAYEFVMKSSHAFNILDARGAISVTERTGYIGRIRDLAKAIAEGYIASREAIGLPLMGRFPGVSVQHADTKSLELSKALLEASATTKATYLLEIGSEELPATFVPIGMANLKRALEQLLEKEGVGYEEVKVYGTPRRLTALVMGLSMALAEQTLERRGPMFDKAFDEMDGRVTATGTGFFRGVGLDVKSKSDLKALKEIEIRELKGVSYIFAKVTQPSRSTALLLQQAIPKLILDLEFPKKMRWADFDITYARPLRWIVSLFGRDVIPFVVGDVVADRVSRGHNQLDCVEFKIDSIDTDEGYLNALKQHKVMADPEERKRVIINQLDEVEQKLGGSVICREQVLAQVVHLVEWPQVTEATFDSRYLKAPKEVLVSEMVEHQKYFPVASVDGTLMHHFVITADTNPSDEIRRGNQKVLSSRLSDGVFLYEKGLKTKLDARIEKLKQVTYMKGLGSLYDKVVRLKGHSAVIQKALGISTKAKVDRAAELSKADLVTEMVYEFPELQGVIGRSYAMAHGEDKEVALAIEEQWMPLGEKGALPQTETGIVLSLADKFDNLISCFATDRRPTSSSDPYALRRQVLGMIKILIANKYHLPFRETLMSCCQNFPEEVFSASASDRRGESCGSGGSCGGRESDGSGGSGESGKCQNNQQKINQQKINQQKNNQQTKIDQVIQEIEDFFVNRIKTVFQDYGFSKDEIEASVANGFTDIYDTFCRVQALHNFRHSNEKFLKLYEVYKRAKGQISQQERQVFSDKLLKEAAEKELHHVMVNSNREFSQAVKGYEYHKAYQLVAEMQVPLARLFDEVHILADDEQVRNNRIALLQNVFGLFDQLLDFSQIKE